jgi:hypothetical protein
MKMVVLKLKEFFFFICSRSSNKNKRGGTRGSPRARRWGRGGPRSLSPTRRVGGGFEVQHTKTESNLPSLAMVNSLWDNRAYGSPFVGLDFFDDSLL